jgi:signal transduction histidine kinase
MGQVGAMLGRVIEREQAESELLEANNRLSRALYDLREAQDRVVQQERLRALGQMASGIAHDFNNALHPIVGYAELLLQNPVLAEAPSAARCLRNILTSATDAGAVVGRLREFYRTRADGEDSAAPVDLGAVVRQVVELTRPRWYSEALAGGVRITVNTEIAATPRILGDAPQLREAVINLVLNAVDSMPHSGTIVLRTRAEQGRVVLDVSDTGVGMTEDVRRHCLEPFFTTKGQRGSGLGLGMVYGIVQRHEGTLDITSSPGLGTTMTLTFPALQAGVSSGSSTISRRRSRSCRSCSSTKDTA